MELGIRKEEHEAVLVEARSKVEAELNKQKLSAENASKREKEAHEKEAEAMKKVEAMMIELKKKEVAITELKESMKHLKIYKPPVHLNQM